MAFNHPIHSLYRGVKGFVSVYRQGLRYRDMITKTALHRSKILSFWDKHGLAATLDAFGVKKRTLFLWKQKLKTGEGNLENLNNLSRSPKTKRKRNRPPEIMVEIKRLHLTHYHTYPRTPKMNAHCERFNRTIQDEFVDYHLDEMLDVDSFNQKLTDYLIWYNTKRVHHAFKNKLSPYQFMLSLPINQIPEKCKSGWPHTIT